MLLRCVAISVATALLVLACERRAIAAEVETEHYTIVTKGERADAEIDEFGRILEQAWVVYSDHFGKQPKLRRDERLGVYFADTIDDFHAEMAAHNLPRINGGGYYSPGNRVAYAWRQPQDYDTRALLIHECAHQFHYLACCNNTGPSATWYIEGIAEYLSNHHWDGTTLIAPVLPWVSPKDNFKGALASFEDGLTVEQMIKGEGGTYPEWWAFYAWLVLGEDGKLRRHFDRLAAVIDRGEWNLRQFTQHIGKPDRVQPAFLEWLRAHQQPFTQVWGYWQHIGEAYLSADSPAVGLCVLKNPAQRISATIHPQPSDADAEPGPWKAGLILSFTDVANFTIAFIDSAARCLRVHAYVDRKWSILGAWELSEGDLTAPVTIDAQCVDDAVSVRVGGQEVTRVELVGDAQRMGFTADRSAVRFADLEWSQPDEGDEGDDD